MDHSQLLGQVPIFQELSKETLSDLAKRVWQKQVEAGSLIVSHEELGDSLFVIAKGKFRRLKSERAKLSNGDVASTHLAQNHTMWSPLRTATRPNPLGAESRFADSPGLILDRRYSRKLAPPLMPVPADFGGIASVV